jgi:methylenetetrahydrofolate dehydrogenase (NADP+)/methenyltetrahydrofolate cyclohydrolase
LNAIDPAKDVDGFHPVNAGKLSIGLPGLVPCTPKGAMILLHEVCPDLRGKRALVVGRSNIVGKPMALMLLQANCTVTMAHSQTHGLADECRQADIVVAALGKPHFIRGEWIKDGAIVIDVGINRVDDPETGKHKLAGDVEFSVAATRAAAITPVPGGVGPMTIACLMLNTFEATLAQNGWSHE